MEHVARRGVHDRRAEFLHEPELALCVAGARGDHGKAGLLGAVMEPETAGKQAVGHHVLENVAPAAARAHHRPCHEARPVVDVFLRVVNDRRDARGAAGHVDAHHSVHWHGEVLARIRVPQIVFRGKRQAPHVEKAFDVVTGEYARFFKLLFIKFRSERPVDGLPQTPKLHELKRRPVHGLEALVQKRNLHSLIRSCFPNGHQPRFPSVAERLLVFRKRALELLRERRAARPLRAWEEKRSECQDNRY